LTGYELKSSGHLLSCPICQGKTRTKVNADTILVNFPLFCPKCKRETVINVNNLKLSVIKAPAV